MTFEDLGMDEKLGWERGNAMQRRAAREHGIEWGGRNCHNSQGCAMAQRCVMGGACVEVPKTPLPNAVVECDSDGGEAD